jgi:DNA repair exonuclease SbcCD ATPase subunit
MTNQKEINNKLKKIEEKEEKLNKKIEEVEKISKTQKIKQSAKEFNNELKKSLNTAIVAAFGFLIALVWKEVITEYVDKITELTPFKGKLISATIVTIICVVGIFIITKMLKVKK